jgi:hypothetical protein
LNYDLVSSYHQHNYYYVCKSYYKTKSHRCRYFLLWSSSIPIEFEDASKDLWNNNLNSLVGINEDRLKDRLIEHQDFFLLEENFPTYDNYLLAVYM